MLPCVEERQSLVASLLCEYGPLSYPPASQSSSAPSQLISADLLLEDGNIEFPAASHAAPMDAFSKTAESAAFRVDAGCDSNVVLAGSESASVRSSTISSHGVPETHLSKRCKTNIDLNIDVLQKHGIEVGNIHIPMCAGRIITALETSINLFRSQLGGDALCVFKIGISGSECNLVTRYEAYKVEGFSRMKLIYASLCLERIEDFEAILIRVFENSKPKLRNESPGGESMRKSNGEPRFAGPYCLYVVGARADQSRRVGS